VGSHGPPTDSVLATVAEEMAYQAHACGVPSVTAEQAEKEKNARDRVARFMGAKPEEVA
jgi:selenocysteine lyase/cysteine desulfurase